MQGIAILLPLTLYVRLAVSNTTEISSPNRTEENDLLTKTVELKDTLNDKVPILKKTINDVPQNCVQMQCKVICFNGKSGEIEKDIKQITTSMNYNCDILDELRLNNYEFPNMIVPINFLGYYTDKIESLYLANSYVTDFEDGAFGKGIFQKFTFQDLKLTCLRRGFFKDVNTKNIQSLTVIQKEHPLQSVCEGTFTDVKYRIKNLSLQVGITCIRNITASNALLNNLVYVDFSNNDLGSNLASDSFNMLSRVEHLDLSQSNINFLPEYVFHKMDSLEYLDLSYNHLTTIAANVFGWAEIPSDLKIYANNNDWDCTCDLKQEMQIIFGKQSPIIYCQSPLDFAGWSVFDHRICEDEIDEITSKITTTQKTITDNQRPISTISSNNEVAGDRESTTGGTYSSTVARPSTNSNIDLACVRQSGPERSNLKIKPASMRFKVKHEPNLSVDVFLQSDDILYISYGLIWFRNATKDYYKMEVDHKKYGFGCFVNISYWTTVDKLLPDTSYTICLVLRKQLTVSPFNCKSLHIPGNLDVHIYTWLTRDSQATGISLFVLGIVIFTFIGITGIFLVLKNKPTMLKGSKRVAMTKGSVNEIVVLPNDRTLEDLRRKEEMLAKRNSKSISNFLPQRRCSTDSTDSYQSYMNANLYEELPAYFKVDPYLSIYNLSAEENDHFYNSMQPPLSADSIKADQVSYAEIPFRNKRISNDPLPEAPKWKKRIEVQQSLCPGDLND